MPDVMTSAAPELRDFAERCNAWPFEEAQKIVERLKRGALPDNGGDLRDRLRALGPAAHRHLRRGGAHDHGAHRVPGPHRGRVPTRLIAFSDDMDGLRKIPGNIPNQELSSRTSAAADRGPRSVRHARELRRAQQCAAARLPRLPSASSTSSCPRPSATGPGRFDAALLRVLARYDDVMTVMLPTLRRGAARDLFAVPADQPEDRQGAAGADRSTTTSRPGPSSSDDPTTASGSRSR